MKSYCTLFSYSSLKLKNISNSLIFIYLFIFSADFFSLSLCFIFLLYSPLSPLFSISLALKFADLNMVVGLGFAGSAKHSRSLFSWRWVVTWNGIRTVVMWRWAIASGTRSLTFTSIIGRRGQCGW